MLSVYQPPRTRVALAAFACLAGLLAGCGGTDGTSAAPDAAAPAGSADQQYDAWENKYRSCLGDKGFELPKEPGKIDFGDRQDAYEVAEDACLKQIGMPPGAGDGSAESKKEMLATALKQVQCLRDRGYDIDDPQSDQAIQVPEGVSQDDLNECLGA
jgi:hypothetical protein